MLLFAADRQVLFSRGVADEVHGHVFGHGHILRPEAGAQAGKVVVKEDIKEPVQAVFDVPMIPSVL